VGAVRPWRHFCGGGAVGYKLESCAGSNFVSAPARHPQNLNLPCTRRSLRNFARTRTLLSAPAPQTNPNPRPPRTFSVSNPCLSENY